MQRSLLAFLVLAICWPALAAPGGAPIPVGVVKSSAPHREIKVLNRDTPGQTVNLAPNLVGGKTNIVVFYADW
ncbi:MAG: hypothetical protein KC910_25190 [Candidatus Eremiobacteraeota bacterium]|nr:hypothetical protein [Candidatus Eremiobacteraeota bacterium]